MFCYTTEGSGSTIRRLSTKHSGIVLVDKMSNERLPIENITLSYMSLAKRSNHPSAESKRT